MEEAVKIFLDALYEFDMLPCHRPKQQGSGRSNRPRFNYTKSISLGILAAADAHKRFGPAVLWYEGGFLGEKKIQQPKTKLVVKRRNVPWPKLVLKKMYADDTIQWIVEQMTGVVGRIDDFWDDSSEREATETDFSGFNQVYRSSDECLKSVVRNQPLGGVLIGSSVYVLYRPRKEQSMSTSWTRSTVCAWEIKFFDEGGHYDSGIWCSPVGVDLDKQPLTFNDAKELSESVDQQVLLLPKTSKEPSEDDVFSNQYHAVGDEWTVRHSNGAFAGQVYSEKVFGDWLGPPVVNNNDEGNAGDQALGGETALSDTEGQLTATRGPKRRREVASGSVRALFVDGIDNDYDSPTSDNDDQSDEDYVD